MLTVADLYTARGLAMKGKGRGARGAEFCGPCPGCGGKDRFLLWPEQNEGRGSYACRQCGKAGDVIQFLMDFDGMDFKEAAARAGMKLEESERRSLPEAPKARWGAPKLIEEAEPNAPQRDESAWLTQAEHYVTTRHEAIMKSPAALAYLKGRGLDEEAVRDYRLGVQQGENGKAHIMRMRKIWGLPDGAPVQEGGKERKFLWLPRGIVIPSSIGGKVRRIRVRRPDADRKKSLENMKYYVVPGSEMIPLFLPMRAGTFKKPIACVVVEAELDAMLVHRAAGDIAAVLGAGTAGLRHLPPSVMAAMRDTPIILVATDAGDESGAGTHGWHLWRDTFPQAVRHPCIHGKDPGEMFQSVPYEEGHALIRRWVLSGLPETYACAAFAAMQERTAPAIPPPDKEAPAAEEEPCREETVEEAEAREEEGFDIALQKLPAELFPLSGHYLGKDLVLMALAAHGLYAEAEEGDIRIKNTGMLHGEKYRELLPFLHRHRVYLDEIAREKNA